MEEWNEDGLDPATEEVPAPPIHIGRERLQFGVVLLAVAFIFGCTTLSQVLLDLALSSLFPTVTGADWYPWVLTSVPMYLVAMPLSLLLFRVGEAHTPPRGERLSLLVLLGLVALSFILTYAGNLIGAIANALVGAVTGELPQNDLEAMTSSAPLWTNLLFVGILAPILEELVYRKLVIDRLRRYGDLFAVLVSGVLFGLVHGNLYQLFYAVAMGILFGYLYVRTGRIRYSVILHLSINLIGGVYTAEMMRNLDLEYFAANPVAALAEQPLGVLMLLLYLSFMALCVLGGIVAAILLCRFWVRRFSFAPPTVHLDARTRVRVFLLNPATLLFFAFLVWLFL